MNAKENTEKNQKRSLQLYMPMMFFWMGMLIQVIGGLGLLWMFIAGVISLIKGKLLVGFALIAAAAIFAWPLQFLKNMAFSLGVSSGARLLKEPEDNQSSIRDVSNKSESSIKEKVSTEDVSGCENTSGLGKESVIPDDIKGWSWGAFLLNGIWSIGNKTWVGLLCFVPLVGLIMPIVLGFKGREWAWRNKKWESIEAFNATQKKWSIWGFVLATIFLFLTAASMYVQFYTYMEYINQVKSNNTQIEIFHDYVKRFSSIDNEIDFSSLTARELNVVGDDQNEILISSYQSCGSGVCSYAVYKSINNDSEYCYLGEIDMSSKDDEILNTSSAIRSECHK